MPLQLLSNCCSASCGPDKAMCAPNLLYAAMCLELVVNMLLRTVLTLRSSPMTHEHWALWMRIGDPPQQDEPLVCIRQGEAHRCCLACGCEE